MIGHEIRLARASQQPNVRAFAEQAEAFLDSADPAAVHSARGYLHTRGFGYLRLESRTVSVEVPRTRRSTVTTVTASVRLDDNGNLSGECECAGETAVCGHLAAALIALVDRFVEDDRQLMRFQGLSDAEVEAMLESRRPGRTRWAATAYSTGTNIEAALARKPGPLPAAPPVPVQPTPPRYADTIHLRGESVNAHQLELQAAIAAAAAHEALNTAAPTTSPATTTPARS
jgi:hypothetical protein